jgi:hypothetical protein
MAELSSILATARDILKENGNKPMHVNDIADLAVKSARNQQMPADEFAVKLSGALAAHLKLKTSSPIFAKPLNKKGRPQKGIYRLKQARETSAQKPIPPQVSTLFTGKAGELAVMSELLFWGYNASLMTVDDGIDIVASQNKDYFHIQVKTSTVKTNGGYSFSVPHKSFAQYSGNDTYYVFVMRKDNALCDYAVIPSSHLSLLKKMDLISGATGLSINIMPDAKGRKFSLNSSDITGLINNFKL